ncbi:hypothetical protein KVV02_006175 [Mortierella alpina]|uniref:MTHFR SAM-binding regulatory domain-containing protein n=1 Tax=Mortierella alpina TaxID=64518 RepID=A0A9P8D109_MORAP|nr:hypothetical protein KVV02_006175 [Mortierella alpina]
MTMIITDLVTKQQDQNLPFYPFTTQTPNNVQFNEAALSFRVVAAARSRGVTQVNSQAQSLQSTPLNPTTGSIADNTFNGRNTYPNPELSPCSGCRSCTRSFCKVESKPACITARDESPNHQHNDIKPSLGLNQARPSRASLKCCAVRDSMQRWSEPRILLDVQELFVRACSQGENPTLLPWCNQPLTTAAFLTIADRIVELNQCGYLAIDSQPAVNGVKSDHDIYGWGLKTGYVYQKAYVEFFISPHQLPALIQRLGRKPHFTFVAANKSGDLQTNIPFSRTGDRCSNVITWGVFPDCEIVQKTVVDLDGFVKWKEEALEVWCQWAHGYPEASEARILLETIGEEWYLVNVVNDDYHDPEGLFTFFEEDRSAQEELRQQ